MDTPSPPQAPDPVATAQAQTAMNKDTAIAQAQLNNVNQITPDYTLTYTKSPTGPGYDYAAFDRAMAAYNARPQSSGQSIADIIANGADVNSDGSIIPFRGNAPQLSDFAIDSGVPQWTATTALTPENQRIHDTNLVTQQNIADIGREQSGRIGDLLGTPLKLGNEETEARLMELGMTRLAPQFARDEESTRTRLANSGIRQGSEAWDAEMGRFGQNKNDAINQLLLNGRSVANQEMLAERNQPINEITALMSGSQVSQPNFVGTPQTPVAGVDYTGLVRDNYNAQMNAYNARVGQGNAAMGGMFGLAGTLGSAALKYGGGAALFSDRRLKTDASRVGTLDNGLPVYSYRYKAGGPVHIGLMADDVERVHPHAVHEIGGFKAVDYAEAVQ